MTVLTEARERFLRTIVKEIPAERIAEVHFFTPLKQGGVESGVAVVAAWPEPATAPEGEEIVDVAPEEAADNVRPVIYTARYRHTLKGPDRGKWETNVVAEADAPLVTVDAVVRGVQRRAGDADDATRMDGDDVRMIVEAWARPNVATPTF
jgi:hypothetical protein